MFLEEAPIISFLGGTLNIHTTPWGINPRKEVLIPACYPRDHPFPLGRPYLRRHKLCIGSVTRFGNSQYWELGTGVSEIVGIYMLML